MIDITLAEYYRNLSYGGVIGFILGAGYVLICVLAIYYGRRFKFRKYLRNSPESIKDEIYLKIDRIIEETKKLSEITNCEYWRSMYNDTLKIFTYIKQKIL